MAIYPENNVRRKNFISRAIYKYDVTIGNYMLTPIEKCIVNLTLLGMLALLTYAMYTSMPSHARLMVQRFYFYIGGSVEKVAHNVGLHKSHSMPIDMSATQPQAAAPIEGLKAEL